MKDYSFLQKKYMVQTYVNRGVTFVRGDGAYLIDQNGEKYLDMMINYGVSIFGHNHPKINEVLIAQLQKLTNLHGSFVSDVRAEASQVLVERCGKNFAQVYWGNSGSEAVEAALKFAVLKTGRKKFISTIGGYHGKTLGALSATDAKKYRNPFEPLLWEFVQHEFNDTNAFAKLIDDTTAAVIIEPIQGESGIVEGTKEYLQTIRKLCTKHGTVLIIDEVQTGMGRTGKFLACEHANISADIYCLGKGLAGGLAIGATVITSEIAQAISRGIHTSTFGGNPFACAGALVTLELLTDEVLEHITEVGNYFIERLLTLKSDNIVTIRGKGCMIGIEVKTGRDEVLKKLQREKILAIPAGDTVVRFLPPYIITKKEIAGVIEVLKNIL
ncbi:aspartate aminotransferase family protein [Candidatus Microgenomates bacterium]|nr:MAG: aspartate aminotransferase family protein [Candidatus Microgenomates bacterium]